MITLIAAVDGNMGLGMKDGRIPWHLRNDMQRFKALTYGRTVVCGRKTFETFPQPNGLPKRDHVVLTRNVDLLNHGNVAYFTDTLSVLRAFCNDELYIIGGAEIYKEFLPHANRLVLTRVHASTDCEVFFPEVTLGDPEWTRIAVENYQADENNQYNYSFETYVRSK